MFNPSSIENDNFNPIDPFKSLPRINDIDLTKHQKGAIEKITKWYKSKSITKKRIFILSGFAGTGKTSIIKYTEQSIGVTSNDVAYMSFTGKASVVMKEKGLDASTIHSTIYNITVDQYGNPDFILKMRHEVSKKLFVIDEISMVSQEILEDLLSFDIPILAIGDEAQLPPIGSPTNIFENADYKLTEIHRQAKNDPIIRLSMDVRNGKSINYGKYSDNVSILRKIPLNRQEVYLSADQILTSYNKTRININNTVRKLKDIKELTPTKGDKVVCRKNNRKEILDDGLTLLNGLIGNIASDVNLDVYSYYNNQFKTMMTTNIFKFHFKPFISDFTFKKLSSDYDTFYNPTPSNSIRSDIQLFQFAYAITIHTSQGSQFDKGIIHANQFGDDDTYRKLLYTAITRFKKKIILVL